ncbi:MAG: hypothetical protein Q9M25_08975 [Mariprofundaceae bacterium]|nr:hypothetical protein [Mariprofundaceae bacterium]
MLSKLQEHLQPRHLGLIGLCLLALAYLSLFRYDNYGIEEGAALALLINWSIVHQIASPVAFFGVPDLRAIFFVPLDMYWAGSLIAVKVFTMYILFGTALMMYRWSEEVHSGESSMMATVLLLLAPITLMQTDAIGSGIYLLFCFVVTGWLDQAIHDSDEAIPSWFFLLILIAALATSMHPMGLAVPLTIALKWWLNPGANNKGRRIIVSMAILTGVILFVRWGWYGMDAASANPLSILSDSILGSDLLRDADWRAGMLIGGLLLAVIGVHVYRRLQDTVSIMLIAASLIGFLHADHAWVLIAWATLLYLGIPFAIEMNQRFGKSGLAAKRGAVLSMIVILATISMVHTRQIGVIAKTHLKSPTDNIIAVLAHDAEKTDTPFLAASQWPARTLLVCRRDVLPLPPAKDDTAAFRRQTRGLTHIAFNPQLEDMHALSRNAASLSDIFETIALLPGGVVLKAKADGKAG